MTRTQRASLLALAAAALVVAFILLRPDADPDQPAPPTTSEPTPAPGADSTSAKAPAEPPRKPASGPLLVADKVQRVDVGKGDRVRFRARSSEPEELHVHGYDIKRELEPSRVARVSFTADIDGIFEIELEKSGVQVGELRVQP